MHNVLNYSDTTRSKETSSDKNILLHQQKYSMYVP